MRLLFEIDKKDYDPRGKVGTRPSVRGIILREGRIAMVHSLKYDYYKFPGGGIDANETHAQALIREIAEETGFAVCPQSIRPYGLVRRIQKGWYEDIFLQDNYYYFCEVQDTAGSQQLDDYEAEERFVAEFVTPAHVLRVNQTHPHGDKESDVQFPVMLDRDNRVLRMLSKEYPAFQMKTER